jgi:streptogramin lyase
MLSGGRSRGRCCLLVTAATIVAVALSQMSAVASLPAPGMVEEFPVETAYKTAIYDLATGPEGGIWYLLSQARAGYLERMTPSGVITGRAELAPPGEHLIGTDIAQGADGNMWVSETEDYDVGADAIARISPADEVTTFRIPHSTVETSRWIGGPTAIVRGADGRMWFTDQRPYDETSSFIGATTSDGHITEYPIPTGAGANTPQESVPAGIVTGANGDLWFTDDGETTHHQNLIGRITPAGVITEYPVPTPESEPVAIALGNDGNLWFSENKAEQIGRITPGGDITEFPVAGLSGGIHGIATGPDGNVWFTQRNSMLGEITPTGIVKSYFPAFISGGSVGNLTIGPEGELWFVDAHPAGVGFNGLSYVGRFGVPIAPAAAGLPSITGMAQSGDVLSATAGTWDGRPTPTQYSYQWERCRSAGEACTVLPGGQSSRYLLGDADVGHAMKVLVTALNIAGQGIAESTPTADVADKPAAAPQPAWSAPVVLAPMPLAPGYTMTWKFTLNHGRTRVRSLVAHGLNPESTIRVTCIGRGCALTRGSPHVRTSVCRSARCTLSLGSGHRSDVALAGIFRSALLRPAATILIEVKEDSAVDRTYEFVVRRRQQPQVHIKCAPQDRSFAVGTC